MTTKKDFEYRVFRKYGFIPIFEGEPQLTNVPSKVIGETFSAWCERVIGQSSKQVNVLRISRPAGQLRVDKLAESRFPIKELLDIHTQRIGRKGVNSSPSKEKACSQKKVASQELSELMNSLMREESPQSLKFIKKFTANHGDVSSWKDMFEEIFDEHLQIINIFYEHVNQPSDLTKEDRLKNIRDGVSIFFERLSTIELEIIEVRNNIYLHSKFDEYSNEYGFAAIPMLILSDLEDYIEELIFAFGALSLFQDTEESLIDLYDAVCDAQEHDALPKRSDLKTIISDRDRDQDEKEHVELIFTYLHGLIDFSTEVQGSFIDDIEDLSEPIKNQMQKACDNLLQNLSDALEIIFEG